MLEINRIHQGDCLEVMKQINDKSIDLILCDLPYGTTACSWDFEIDLQKLWIEYKRIIKDKGIIVLTASQPFTSRLVMSNPKMFKYEWIWEKHKGVGHLNVKKMPLKIHENILIFYSINNYYPQMESGVPYKKRGSHNITPNGIVYNNSEPLRTGYSKDFDSAERYPKSIIKFSNHNQKDNRFHPTQKPVELFEYLIKTYTNEGDLVLDNCIGSGTTAIACIKTNRNFIGIELEEKYVDIANKRIDELSKIGDNSEVKE